MDRLKPSPIGIQTFSHITEGGYLYVDKTRHIYEKYHDYANRFEQSRKPLELIGVNFDMAQGEIAQWLHETL